MSLVLIIHTNQRKKTLSKKYDVFSWLKRWKYLIHNEPKSTDDLFQVLRNAQSQTLINTETLAMLEGVILFAHMKVRDIMLPKNQIIWIASNSSFDEILKTVTHSGHSRFPIMGDDTDDVVGILHAKDLLRFAGSNLAHFDLLDIVRKPTVVPESKRIDLLLSEFRLNRNHMAIVVDEYGAVSGFVTLEDIIEQIIGDIADEFDIDEEAHIKFHKEHCYILKAHTPIEDFNERLSASFSHNDYDTIGGIVMAAFKHLPKRGEQITINGFLFKILHADARRIKLLECIDQRHANQNDP